jgi:peptide/nickel transport system permease protein
MGNVTTYILRCLGQSVVVLFGVTLIVFLLVHMLPGGPAKAMLGPTATLQQVRYFTIENGWNLPVLEQYVHYMGRLFQGNLGFSYTYNQSVGSLLEDDIPKTALLIGLAYVCTMLIAVPIGIIQALRSNTAVDHAITASAFVAYSMPTFWLSTLLILWFSVSIHLFPSEGPQGATVRAALDDPRALVLPVASLTVVSVALFSRFVRSSAMTVLVQDYIRTARGKGVPLTRLVRKHLLRNALSPMVTLFGVSLPFVIGGAIVVESVYNYPGMGLLLWKAATSRDYPLLMGFTLVVGVATVVGNLIADVLYAVVDPRVRYE